MKKFNVSVTMQFSDATKFISKLMDLAKEGDELSMKLVNFMEARVSFTYRAEDDHMLFAWLAIEHQEVFSYPEANITWEYVGEDPGPTFGFEGFFD